MEEYTFLTSLSGNRYFEVEVKRRIEGGRGRKSGRWEAKEEKTVSRYHSSSRDALFHSHDPTTCYLIKQFHM